MSRYSLFRFATHAISMENELAAASKHDAEPSPGRGNEDLRKSDRTIDIVAAPGASIDVATLLKQGMSFHQAGRLAEAEMAYQQILKSAPRNFDALHFLGIIHYQRGNLANAMRYIDLALGTNPGAAAAQGNRGNLLQALKRFDEALTCYERAIALRPDYAEAFSDRGLALQELKRFDEALACYDRAIALRPDYAEAFNNRGNALQALKRPDQALACYDRAISLRPDYAEAFNNRGVAFQGAQTPRRGSDELRLGDRAQAGLHRST